MLHATRESVFSSVPAGVRLRSYGEDDVEFLCSVYRSTRAEEMALTVWSPPQIEAFLRDQFRLQRHHYETYYAGASFDVVELDGQPIGRLYVYRGATELRVMDISLLPEFRGRGIGTFLLAGLIAEAQAKRQSVTLHVEFNNPARALYHRLGFTQQGELQGVYIPMTLPPPAFATEPA